MVSPDMGPCRNGATMNHRIEPLAPGRRGLVVQHERGRVCDVLNCGTQLSIYNGSDRCSVHEGFTQRSRNATATGRVFGAETTPSQMRLNAR